MRPWEISALGETIEIHGETKTFQQIRQELYERIVDEAVYIARASDGAISVEWVLSQPIAVRKKYIESFNEELEKRKQTLEKMKKNRR